METPTPDPADVASIDAIVRSAYDSISGPAGTRDWNRLRSLFIPGARFVPTAENAGEANLGGKPQMLDIDGFISRCAAHFAKNGFYEKEIARRTEQFGLVAHVWSTYESRHRADDPKPFMGGINSIQLFYDGTRWWIVSIYWQQEGPEHPVPEKYL
jgi:hypothetical protein